MSEIWFKKVNLSLQKLFRMSMVEVKTLKKTEQKENQNSNGEDTSSYIYNKIIMIIFMEFNNITKLLRNRKMFDFYFICSRP